jgi:2-hydroxy-6-oxo-6-(2'-carboxyphenyl)-hexa-2,4-dienoate hydrolase
VRTRYYEDGQGEPLVLVHGGQFGPGYSLDSWSLNLPVLARRFHVYALDRLGQGHTGNPRTDDDYTAEALYRHFRGFLDAAGVGPASFVGHSRGALPITRLALETPDRVRTLIIVSSNTLAPEDPSFPSGTFYAEIARRTPPGPPTRESVRLEPEGQAYSTAHITEDFTARLLEIALLPKTLEAAERMRVVGNTIWNPSLDRMRDEAIEQIEARGLPVPTLVVWGLNDVSAPLRVHGLPLFDRIAARTPHAGLHVVNETGHYVFREQPETFHRLVESFAIG